MPWTTTSLTDVTGPCASGETAAEIQKRRGHQAQVQAEGRMNYYLLRIIAADARERVRRGQGPFVRGRWKDGE